MTRLASDKQKAFLQSLLDTRQSDITAVDFEVLSSTQASNLIDQLLKQPYKTQPDLPKVGMYRTADGTIYRVHKSRETGNLYAKELDAITGKFSYVAGAIRKLNSTNRMTLEQAKLWGLETGLCCVCGLFLTDEKSVANGIGPVCEKKVGLW